VLISYVKFKFGPEFLQIDKLLQLERPVMFRNVRVGFHPIPRATRTAIVVLGNVPSRKVIQGRCSSSVNLLPLPLIPGPLAFAENPS
jgi:hypothetical protein